jgi:hypothetical protein
MPPRPNRPQVLKRNVAELPAAAAPAPAALETYSVNGVNYTTYTTFRSPMTPGKKSFHLVVVHVASK